MTGTWVAGKESGAADNEALLRLQPALGAGVLHKALFENPLLCCIATDRQGLILILALVLNTCWVTQPQASSISAA